MFLMILDSTETFAIDLLHLTRSAGYRSSPFRTGVKIDLLLAGRFHIGSFGCMEGPQTLTNSWSKKVGRGLIVHRRVEKRV